MIDFTKIYQLKGPKPQKQRPNTNFYELYDLTKKYIVISRYTFDSEDLHFFATDSTTDTDEEEDDEEEEVIA